MRPTTLCFPINKNGEILLGMKKRGFGAGKYNGFGGKIEGDESFRECACREMLEEVSLLAKPNDLELIAFLNFLFPFAEEDNHICYVYLAKKYHGIPLESEEMSPCWFKITDLPFDEMWEGDRTWLPELLKGKKLIGEVIFKEDGSSVESMKFTEVCEIPENIHEKL